VVGYHHSPWIWQQHGPPKHWYHITTQNTWTWIFSGVKTKTLATSKLKSAYQSEYPLTCQNSSHVKCEYKCCHYTNCLALKLYSIFINNDKISWRLCSWSCFQWFKTLSQRPNFFLMISKKWIIFIITICATFIKLSENKSSNNVDLLKTISDKIQTVHHNQKQCI
jgi:hypothetical protein